MSGSSTSAPSRARSLEGCLPISGADVVKVEPASGDPLRRCPPFDAGTGRSLRFWAWNLNKRTAATAIDGDGIGDLLAGADMVLASSPEGPGDPGAPPRQPDHGHAFRPDRTHGGMARVRSHLPRRQRLSVHDRRRDRPPVRCSPNRWPTPTSAARWPWAALTAHWRRARPST